MDIEEENTRLREKNAALREALYDMWRVVHDEYCTNEWPHEGRCNCPLPDLLKEPVAAQ